MQIYGMENRKVLITFKADKDGRVRMPFETTEMNIENQERLHGKFIKKIEFIDGSKPVKRTETKNVSSTVSDDDLIKALLDKGKSPKEIAVLLDIPVKTINKVALEAA